MYKTLGLGITGLSLFILLLVCDASPANPHVVRRVQIQTFQQNIPVFAIGVPVQNLGLDYYYSVGYDFQREEIVDDVLRRIDERNQHEDDEDEVKREDFTFITQGPIDLVSSEELVTRVFKDNCIMCHKAGATKPGVQLFNADGTLFRGRNGKEQARRLLVYENVLSGNMPRGKKPLSADQKQIVRKWALEG